MPNGGEWMFEVPEPATRQDTFRWWEARRPNFNILLFAVGVVTWILVLVAGSQAVKPGVDFEEPIIMIVGPPIYAVLANICYSGGSIIDVVFYVGHPRLWLFRAGLYFSLALTALPGIWAVLAWLMTVYTGKKLD
jgi:hypothetical protein